MMAAHPPEALRRTTAAELRAAVQAGCAALPGVGLGLLSLAALLDRRTPLAGDEVDRLRDAVGRLLDVLTLGRPAAAGVAVPLRFARALPARAAR